MRLPRALCPPRLSILALLTLIAYANSQSQKDLLCKYPGTRNCVMWLVNLQDDEISADTHITTKIPEFCGFSDEQFIPYREKYVKVTQIEKVRPLKIWCKKVILLGRLFDWKEVENALSTHSRTRRQSFIPRGRYRGQTQSQYLAIDKGNGKDEGRAEAHSAADSSRASVSGNSGMGQAQSQSIYDPNCDDCYGKPSHEVENLKRPVGSQPGKGIYGPNTGSSWPNSDKFGAIQPTGPGTSGYIGYIPNGVTNGGYSPTVTGSGDFRPGESSTNNRYGPINKTGIAPNGVSNVYDPQVNSVTSKTRPGDYISPGAEGTSGLPEDINKYEPGRNHNDFRTTRPQTGFRPDTEINRGPGGGGYFPNQGNIFTHRQGDTPAGSGGNLPQSGTYGPGQTSYNNQPTQSELSGSPGTSSTGIGYNPRQVGANFIPGWPGGNYGPTKESPTGFGTVQGGIPNINWPIASGPYPTPGGTVYCCVVPNTGVPNLSGGQTPYNSQIPYGGYYKTGSDGSAPSNLGQQYGLPGSIATPGTQYIHGGSSVPGGQYTSGGAVGPSTTGGQYLPGGIGNGRQYIPGDIKGFPIPDRQYIPGIITGRPGDTSSSSLPGGQYMPGGTGSAAGPGGQYSIPGGIGSSIPGSKYLPGTQYVPGTQYLPGIQYLPGTQYVSGGVRVGPSGTGSSSIPGGQYIPDVNRGSSIPGGQYLPGGNSGSTVPGGQYTPGGTIISTGPGEQYKPGDNSGSTVPGGQYAPPGTGVSLGPEGQYIPSNNHGFTAPGGQYTPSGTGVSSGPGVQYVPSGSGGPTAPSGEYVPGGNRGYSGPGGQYIPGITDTFMPGGQYAPGGTGGATVPGGQYAPGGAGGSTVSGGQYSPGGTGGSTVPGGQYLPGGTGGTTVHGGQYTPGGTVGSTLPGGQYMPGGTGDGPNNAGDSLLPRGQYIPGGPSVPGGQYIPRGSSVTGGQYLPSGSLVPGGTYTPGVLTPGGQYLPNGSPVDGGQYVPGGSSGTAVPGGQYAPSDTRGGPGVASGTTVPAGQYIPGGIGSINTPENGYRPGGIDGNTAPGQYLPVNTGGSTLPGSQYGSGNTAGSGVPGRQGELPSSGGAYGTNPQEYYNQGNSKGQGNEYNGIPQNYLDPKTVITDEDESEAEANVAQNINGTTASASSKGGNDKGRAQTSVQGTYTGSGSFQAQAQITGDNKEAQSEVSGGKKGASSSASGSGRNNKSQANVQLGSETGSVQTQSQSNGVMHSSNSQVQGSVKGGMADAQARGPGSTSSQAQIGFTPYKDEEKTRHDLQRIPFSGGGMASAQSSGRTGQSQTQLHGTFKYGITYNGAAQSGASLDKDAVFPNRLSFEKINVFDEKNKNINVDKINIDTTETPQALGSEISSLETSTLSESYDTNEKIDTPTTENIVDESMKNSESRYSGHAHIDHHVSEPFNSTNINVPTSIGGRRSFQTNNENIPDYEFSTDKEDTQPEYETDVGYEGDGNDATEVEQNEYSNYDEYTRDSLSHQYLQNSNKKGLDVRQTTAGNTQHILLGSLKGHNAEIVQKDTERPDENKVYQPGERVPGTGGYTIPVGFTGSVKSVASKDKTYVVGSKDFPSQAQTVTLTPGTGKIKYIHPSSYGKYVKPKNLRSLQSPKENDNRYVSVSKSVTRALDSDNNIRKQYSHTYYTKSSSCGYFTFTCTMVTSAEGRKKVCKPKMPTNPDGSPIRC